MKKEAFGVTKLGARWGMTWGKAPLYLRLASFLHSAQGRSIKKNRKKRRDQLTQVDGFCDSNQSNASVWPLVSHWFL